MVFHFNSENFVSSRFLTGFLQCFITKSVRRRRMLLLVALYFAKWFWFSSPLFTTRLARLRSQTWVTTIFRVLILNDFICFLLPARQMLCIDIIQVNFLSANCPRINHWKLRVRPVTPVTGVIARLIVVGPRVVVRSSLSRFAKRKCFVSCVRFENCASMPHQWLVCLPVLECVLCV